MATIYDVAKRANVSAMTVSRVINNGSSIKESTRLRVEKAIKELDYIPNRSAQSLISKDTKLLSLLITDVANPFFTSIARGAEDKAHEKGYQLVFSNSDENIEKETSYIRSAVSRGIDGMLLTPSGDFSIQNINILTKYKIPFVLVDRSLKGIESDIVHGDNSDGTKKLMDHLFENGHRTIGFVTGPSSISNVRERGDAYKQFIKDNKLPFNEKWTFQTDLARMQTLSYINLLLEASKEDRPTAILCSNNFLAADLVNNMNKMGLHVPDDISVVCFDDPHAIQMPNSFFTVVNQPAYKFGYTGMEMLIDRIEGKSGKEHKEIVYDTELIIRQSTKKIN
ncbi:LacI family DNA-binding transcriptional regulator [Aquibacillus halophilus]|uniref:LacI family DNA-binding transcriptional regulator n=1 Tax=Aquibacillus halophilus TaxID=930132 RepID=A0A6A8D5N2_9BACI|nr:LacI family DNA-binding transcriptional regulator [Aquibacillus halophilus]MRH41065.1 LacI family DNA-binding transcriptional regulator [Aquibacillus halophilus]